MYHNKHMDEVRAINKAHAFPTKLNPSDLACVVLAAENAMAQLRAAYKYGLDDNVVKIRLDSAGNALKQLRESANARLEQFS